MSTEAKAIVRRLYEEVWNKRRLELVSDLISPSHALHDNNSSGSSVGPEAYRAEIAVYLAAFPDLRFTVEDTVAEKDKVAASWTISGTHKGEYWGVRPTNKKISLDGITIHHIANGKIIDSYISSDTVGLMCQLGLVPARPQRKSAAR
ncbi:MAG TPA: ester cyclase [Candidatus Acidoferrum sp.]|nr:ester cyclase [Candidatus Acidoferrum sp.]